MDPHAAPLLTHEATAQFMLIGTMKTAAPLGDDIELTVAPGTTIAAYPQNCNAHTDKRLLIAMRDPCTLAVFDVKTGTQNVLRVAYGAKHLWPSTLRTVHLSMHHAIACAGHFTHARPNASLGRAPTQRRRDHAVAELGSAYNVPHTRAPKESVGSYDGESHDDSASDSDSGADSGADSGSLSRP